MTLQYLPVIPASTLNAAAKKPLQAAAEYATLRVLYGRCRVPALIANVLDYNGSWVIQSIWGEGPIQAVESYTFDGKEPTGTVTHHLGGGGQVVNPTLAAAFAAKGLSYADALPGIAYSVFVVPAGTDAGMPTIEAIVQGRLLYDPRQNLLPGSNNGAGWSSYFGPDEFRSTAASTVQTAYIYSPYVSVAAGATLTLSFESKQIGSILGCDLYVLPNAFATEGLVNRQYLRSSDWVKQVFTFTAPAGWVSPVRVRFDHNGGDGTSASICIRNVQLEPGSIATSYTKTTTTATVPHTDYSTNPALALADFASSALYGMGLTVDYPSVMEVANACDALVGGVKRRELGLALSAPQESTAWMDTLSTYAGCWAIKDGARVFLVPDRPAEVSRTFDHASGQILKLGSLKRRGMSGMPTALEVRYTETSTVPWRDASVWAYLPGVAEGTYPRRESQVLLPGIQSASRAQREAIERLNKLTMADLSCTLEAFDEALSVSPGDVVAVSHPLGLADKQFRVQSISSDLGRHSLTLMEYDPQAYSDVVSASPTFPDTALANPLAPPAAVTGLSVVEEVYVAQDGTVASRLRTAWTPVTDLWPCEYLVTITRMATYWGGAGDTLVESTTTVGGFHVLGPVEDGYFYRVSVRARRLNFAVLGGELSFTVKALGKTLPPANVLSLTATATPTGLVLSWPAVIDIDFKGYRVKEGTWASGTLLQDTSATSINIGFAAVGAHTYVIKALDWSGNESAAVATANFTVVAPSGVAPVTQFIDTDLEIRWTAVTGTFPVVRHDIRHGSSWAAGVHVASVQATTVRQKVEWDSRQFWVAAVDAAGNIGATTGTTTAVVTPYSGVTSLALAILGTDARLTWGAATNGSLLLDFYEVRVGATFATATVIGTTQALSLTTPVKWSTAQTLWVVACDLRGTYGPGVSVAAPFSLPAAPVVSKQLIGVKAELSWVTPSATFAIKEYSVRHGASWAAGAATEVRIATTNLRVAVNWVGMRTYFVAAVDANGNLGTASAGTAVQIDAPSEPTMDGVASSVGGVLLDQYRLAWSSPALTVNQLPVDFYTVSQDGTVLDNTYSTTYMAIANWVGDRTFTVQAFDINGNAGAVATKTLSVSAPTAPVITAQTIDNNVLLYWSGSSATLPVRTYELRKGPTWASGQLIGEKSGGFTTVLETVGGVYTYWVAGVDSANNVGAPTQHTATVAQPPDYVLNAMYQSTFAGVNVTKVNMVTDADGSQLMGVNTAETWTTHFTSRGWASPQAQVDALYPVFLEPALLPSTYTEVFDYGSLLPATKVTVLTDGSVVSGSPGLSYELATSVDKVSWSVVAGVTSVYATGFRYVRVKVTVVGGQYDLGQLTLTLDSKIKNDAGSLTASAGDVGGTAVNFNVPFVDVASINVTALGTTPVTAIYDFVDTPYPTTFRVLLFNQAGARVSGTVSWAARGY